MKSLFDQNFKYTSEAVQIEGEFTTHIAPLFRRYVEEGYSPRDLQILLLNSIFEEGLISILNNDAQRSTLQVQVPAAAPSENLSPESTT